MKLEVQKNREADLYLARQFGHEFVREMNSQRVRADFNRVFKNDGEALIEFEHGIVEEDQKRLAMGMTSEAFCAFHQAKQGVMAKGRRSNGKGSV